MFNTTENKTTFNAPASGVIQKSNPKSYFVRMHHKSPCSDKLFEPNGKYGDKEVLVLQVLLTHENWFLVEVINKVDFI